VKKEMGNLNPSEMIESHGTMGFFGGNLEIYTSISESKHSDAEIIKNFEKQEMLERISKYTLSGDVKYFVEEYEKFFTERNVFLWKWLGPIFKESGVTLSSIDNNYADSLTDNKIILTILACILDDVADVLQDKELLSKMSSMFNNASNVDISEKNEKIILVKKIWEHLLNELNKYPRFEEFKDIFMYDLSQLINAVNYSCLVNNNPSIINIHEMEDYDSHNMLVFLYNGMDLMASPEIDKSDLSFLRVAFTYAQKMARIGNWLSTWKRELHEGDISSGVFAYAISKKIINFDEIGKLSDEEIIEKIEDSDTYDYFLDVWKQYRVKLFSLKESIKSIDMDAYIAGLDYVIKFQMAREGLK